MRMLKFEIWRRNKYKSKLPHPMRSHALTFDHPLVGELSYSINYIRLKY